MNLKKTSMRILALALCLLTAFAVAAPATAAPISYYAVISADNTPVYGSSTMATVIGYFAKDDVIPIVSASGSLYQVYTNGATATSVGFILKSAVPGVTNTIRSGQAIASMKAANGTVITTGTTTTTGTPGYITNCNSDVNFRATASAKGSLLGTLNKNAVVSILGEESGFTKLVSAAGVTGYVSKTYVKAGTPPTSASTSTSTSASGSTGTIVNCKSSVTFRSGASTKSKSLGSLKKGATVEVLGSEGDFYKIKYNGKTGYVAKQYLSVGGSGSSSGSSGGSKGSGDINVTPGASKPSATVQNGFDAAKKQNSETIGYVYIAGSNISYPILFNKDTNYYDSHSISKASSSAGAVHAFYNVLARNNTVTAHNMRGSNQMFHQLSHIYDKATGKTTCQTTDNGGCKSPNLSSIKDINVASNRVWEVYLNGYTQWEVFAFYKTEASEPATTINYNIQHLSSASDSEITNWINTQKNRSAVKFNTSVTAKDTFLTLYTCGTNYDYATAQSRIYFFLKAVK